MEAEAQNETGASVDAHSRMSLLRDGSSKYERDLIYRAIWNLAWPAVFAQGIRSIVMFVVRVVVSDMGEKAYNSVNIGLMVFMIILTIIAAVAVGSTAMVAQCWGAGDKERAGRVLQQSLMWGLLISIGIAIIGMPASHLLFSLLDADAETVKLGSSFMVWLFVAVPVMTPGFFLASGLRAAGDTKTPMVGAIIMGVLSVVLSYGLTLGKLGMPRLGILGASLAIGGSFSSFTVFLAILFGLNRTVIKLPLRGWKPDIKIGAAMLKIGLPSAFEWILIQVGILWYVVVFYHYGDEAVAGYFTGIAILVFAHSTGMGFQTAAATIVGQSIGAKRFDRAESVFRHCAALSFGSMLVVGLIIYILTAPSLLSLLFGKLSAESITHARTFITLLVFAMPLMGVSFSMAGGLRGAGDTVAPLIASTVGVYLGRILTAFGLYYLFEPPIFVIWLSMFPDLILRILIMSLRLKSGKWKRVKV